ncbi:hypothetical protein [Burkholderia ubonensis]|uniref:hypothetical protein n=1 Tax=Burkholderia ubonensis TaxID=101571 RepID=UPI0012FD792A|nr:hypothetical protein [Burkholderia ubonensis]
MKPLLLKNAHGYRFRTAGERGSDRDVPGGLHDLRAAASAGSVLAGILCSNVPGLRS